MEPSWTEQLLEDYTAVLDNDQDSYEMSLALAKHARPSHEAGPTDEQWRTAAGEALREWLEPLYLPVWNDDTLGALLLRQLLANPGGAFWHQLGRYYVEALFEGEYLELPEEATA